jgi:hypothetical protein
MVRAGGIATVASGSGYNFSFEARKAAFTRSTKTTDGWSTPGTIVIAAADESGGD